MGAKEQIRILSGAIDEVGGEIVLRGVVDPDSYHLLKVGEYQREVLAISTINGIITGLEGRGVPDIELGMRGGAVRDRDGIYFLSDDVYIVDGLQRVTAAREMVKRDPKKKPRLGATIYVNTTEQWERERFKTLNQDRIKVSPNILLRNMRSENPAVETLFNLCSDKTFVLADRVAWGQRMSRQQLISSTTLVKIAGRLHAGIAPGKSVSIDAIASGLERAIKQTGRNIFRDNVKTFFDVLDQAWGVRTITYKEGAVYLRYAFMAVLARLFSSHKDFWSGGRLKVDVGTIRKLKSFPITTDPNIRGLIGSGGGSGIPLLYSILIQHMNSGRRTHRLVENVQTSHRAQKSRKAEIATVQ